MSEQMQWAMDFFSLGFVNLLDITMGKFFPKMIIGKRLWYRLTEEQTAIYTRFCLYEEMACAFSWFLAAIVVYVTTINPWIVLGIASFFILAFALYGRHWRKQFLGEMM